MISYLCITLLLLSYALTSPLSAAAFDINEMFFLNNPDVVSFSGGNIGQIISILIPNSIVFAGIFCFLLIIYGGFQLIVYGGQFNSSQRVAQSKSMVTYGFIGFLLVVSAYFILQLISVLIGVNFINPPTT